MLSGFGFWPASSPGQIELGSTMCFVILLVGYNSVVNLPLSLYSTFVLEEKHGFNNQTLGSFVKRFIVNITCSVLQTIDVAAWTVIIVLKGGQYFYCWLWVFRVCYLVLLPDICSSPSTDMIDKYTPLKEGPLRSRIEALAARTNFPLTKIYVVDSSSISAHSSAYLFGFFNKRIVLFDTLIKGYVSEDKDKDKDEQASEEKPKEEKKEETGCDDNVVEAIVAHELGHWKLNHVLKKTVISQVYQLFALCVFVLYYRESALYEAFGFPKKSEMPVLIGLIIVENYVLQICNLLMDFVKIVFSRHVEYQADAFAADLGYGSDLKEGLIKLYKDNLEFPIYDPLYAAWYRTHPTLLQRLRAIDRLIKKAN